MGPTLYIAFILLFSVILHMGEFIGMAELTAGEFLKPLTAWKIPPPMAPMVKAPPQSSTILHGLKKHSMVNEHTQADKHTGLYQFASGS